jgi:hypothetical protein
MFSRVKAISIERDQQNVKPPSQDDSVFLSAKPEDKEVETYGLHIE